MAEEPLNGRGCCGICIPVFNFMVSKMAIRKGGDSSCQSQSQSQMSPECQMSLHQGWIAGWAVGQIRTSDSQKPQMRLSLVTGDADGWRGQGGPGTGRLAFLVGLQVTLLYAQSRQIGGAF